MASVAPLPVVGTSRTGLSTSTRLRGGVVVVATRQCPRCQRATEVRLAQFIVGTGERRVLWVCETCGGNVPGKTGGMYVPHSDVAAQGVVVEDLPIWRDDSRDYRCMRCGARGAQLHHWAPSAMFGDADGWPKDYLCQRCHDEWHEAVTPQLRRRNGGG